ncbi:RNA-binding protein [Phanerochaete sordida]|uniref:RNA-binding protein n=1 Tax=Phanerochaete sordida TaxID=48140 RepID=A0A9P3GD06_9APHY|nr:RNA-binding protein [Phanerochaete sordida]
MNHHNSFVPPSQTKPVSLFIGSISGGITDQFLNNLLSACGPISSFKRLITPANKPQGFGFAEFQDPDGALRAMGLLNGVELPALEDGCVNKKLLVKADEKTKVFLDAYSGQKMKTDHDEEIMRQAKARVDALVADIHKASQDAADQGLIDKEKYVIPPHLHDLQEADLPETQRGLVMTEIAQFRERAAKREREKLRDVQAAVPNILSMPSGPKQREWGKPGPAQSPQAGRGTPFSKTPGFVKAGEDGTSGSGTEMENLVSRSVKTDEELEAERKEARRRDEENSFKDRERRYEPRERSRIQALERSIARETALKEAEERDRVEMRARLDVWDDDESDELFYTDRARWRTQRVRRLAAEEAADAESRIYEEREAENLRRESEAFLARQMDEMQALQEEQRKAGMLLEDGAPVKLSVSLAPAVPKAEGAPENKAADVFGADEEEEEGIRKRKVPLPTLDLAESGEKAKERLEQIRTSVPTDKETLFKSKVRWDGVTDTMIDRKLEPLVKRLMVKFLGELEDDDLVMFVLEHLKDHKGPQKLIEGLEPVLEEEASELVIGVWRQIIFESMAYGEGLHTERMMVD